MQSKTTASLAKLSISVTLFVSCEFDYLLMNGILLEACSLEEIRFLADLLVLVGFNTGLESFQSVEEPFEFFLESGMFVFS